MKNGITIVVSIVLLILTIGLVFFPKHLFLSRFSPQGTVSLANLAETTSAERVAFYDNEPVLIPPFIQEIIRAPKPTALASKVLGESSGPKRIEVDLTNQRLYTFEGDKMIHNFLVSTGKWGRTPPGTFNIWIKLRSTKMEGGSKALRTYYYLPNVPYVMYFYNAEIPKWRGYGIHGAYWHNNFGHPMSHGCINMKPEEAGIVYEWTQPDLQGKSSIYASEENPGTPITIYGTAPAS
jgi:lipoprotein-anchoring transpeptidase ErfK/SrfK